MRELRVLAPDLLILREYVDNPWSGLLNDRLRGLGLSHILWSAPAVGQDQVLIACRYEIEEGDLRAPSNLPEAPTNVLHVRCLTEDFEVLGVRLRLHSIGKIERETRRKWWAWLVDLASRLKERPFIISGDFNTGETCPVAPDANKQLLGSGWQHPVPDEGPSDWGIEETSSRPDHTFLTHHWTVSSALYDSTLAESQRQILHFALVVETNRASV